MPRRLSRRDIAEHMADQLLAETGRAKAVKELAAYLIDSRRTKELDLIIRDIQYILAERGVISGTVLSAFTLTAETKTAIEKLVKSRTGAKTVSLDTQVSPELIGGIKISLPGRELDRTVAHQLTILKTRFKKA